LLTAAALGQAKGAVVGAAVGATSTIGGRPVAMTEALRPAMLDAIRRQVMARVVAVRAPLRPQLAAADAAARRAVQDRMRAAVRPFLDELRGYPGARFAADPAVQDEVLAALTLDGEGHAEDELADQAAHGADGPRDRARATGRLPTGAWCGAFAFTQQRAAGLGDHARRSMHATGPHGGIDSLLDYEHRQEVVWTGDAWQRVRDYHSARGSMRRLTRTSTVPTQITPGSVAAPRGLDIRPGDIILIDNARGVYADHITQCRSYDAATGMVETIAGNEGGGAGQVAASAAPRDLNHNAAATTVGDDEHKRARVYAFGRFSVIDYETHVYLERMPADPHQSPDAMADHHEPRAASAATTSSSSCG
ncbi:MAG TPA: hypothetical protein VGC42_04395, partial [Kofleriaceae bacterium]